MSNRPASLIELDAVVSRDDAQPESRSDEYAVEAGTPLCKLCQGFDIQSFTRSSTRRRGYLLRHVEAAADACEFCSLLLDSVKDIEKPTYFYLRSFSDYRDQEVLNPDLYVHMTLSENYAISRKQYGSLPSGVNRLSTEVGDRIGDLKSASDHELCLAADSNSPAATNGDISGRYLGRNPASDEYYVMIRNWIRACSNHPKCNQTVSGSASIEAHNSPLPARCIEISKGGKGIHIRETEGELGAYITLTHRWNHETENCRTTASNYNNRLKGIGFGTLPRLFQDVFIIAQELDVSYVWIDSMCIIQQGDNGADWRREAPKMAQYYQYSLFTIADTMADLGKGLLHPYAEDVTPWASRLVRLPYRDKSGAQAGHFYAYRRKVPLLDDYSALIRNCILSRRGWVLQEWLLSKRLLWYTPKGLFLECHTNTPTTDGQESINLLLASPDLRTYLGLKASFHFTEPSILDFWYKMLETYSTCHLTKPSADRLLAIAGLAKEVGLILSKSNYKSDTDMEAQNEAYLSGVWLRDIHHGLLWEEDHSAEPWTMRIDEAPSWSWASPMIPVKWSEREKGTQEACTITGICRQRREGEHQVPEYCVVKNRFIRPPGIANPVAAGSEEPVSYLSRMLSCLHIRGKLCTVHVRGYLETTENLYTAAFSTAYAPTPTDCQWRAICAPTRPETIAGWGSLEQLRVQGTGCADFGTAVHALHVSTRYLRSGFVLKRADLVLDVLFLQQVDPESHAYTRLGVGRIADRKLVEEFLEAQDEDIQLL